MAGLWPTFDFAGLPNRFPWMRFLIQPAFLQLLVTFLAILFIILGLRLNAPYAALRVGTGRLNGKRPKEKLALMNNDEADLLLQRMTSGRQKKEAYEFLCQLWEPLLRNDSGLSLLKTSSGHSLPIVKVELPQLTQDGAQNPLDTLLRLSHASRFPDFSKEHLPQSEDKFFRWPEPRYLRRYKGPTADQTGFKDDYEGLNVCLQGMTFSSGAVSLPIECIPKLYIRA